MRNLSRIFLVSVLLASVLHFGSAQQRRGQNNKFRAEQDVLDNILKSEVRLNPGGNETHAGATVVNVEIYVRSIDEFDETRGELSTQLTLRQRWFDSRLSFSQSNSEGLKFVVLQGENADKIWTPDLFIGNEKKARLHDYSHPNRFIRIYPNGEVLLSERVSVTSACPLNLRNFPFDRQYCELRLASYGHTTVDVVFQWKASNPVQVSKNLYLPKLTLEDYVTDYCHAETTTGVYSCIDINFHLKRESNFYFVHVFIPLWMLTIIAYFAFWLSPKDVLPRLLLNTFALGLMVLHITDFNTRTTSTSYTKAVDHFTGTSLTFGLTALLESVIVNYWTRREANQDPADAKRSKEGQTLNEEREPETEPLKPGADVESGKPGEQPPAAKKRSRINADKYLTPFWRKQDNTSDKIDSVARVAYPFLVVLYNIIFFAICATRN